MEIQKSKLCAQNLGPQFIKPIIQIIPHNGLVPLVFSRFGSANKKSSKSTSVVASEVVDWDGAVQSGK